MLIAIAYFAKNLVSFVSVLFGAPDEIAENLGFIAMIITGISVFMYFNKKRKKY